MPEQSIFGGFKIKLTVWPLKRSETLLQTIGCITYSDKHAQYYTYPVAGMSSAFLNMTHRVKFLVEIENFTNQPLYWVNHEMKSGGYHNCPPIVIMAGHKGSFFGRKIRDLPRFFDQVGHRTINASIENKHFFTK